MSCLQFQELGHKRPTGAENLQNSATAQRRATAGQFTSERGRIRLIGQHEEKFSL